ncbi:DUF982 domain-containing protein [Mesorhizobium sp. INR15]|uniref:DUF982 domain-containing protein n=1 Tax=Mesorhizobium sp. INR15 TaxID=2654248 RepID=UPI0018964FD7|nr:DUF982 domain-containing protein [Mesorhizobium sp. INR15]QPC95066.1 DUF982 domain-containing protein [Mesorhizobium sp. INR15]
MLTFSSPVRVKSPRIGITREVNNVETAAEELLTWRSRSITWKAAIAACLAAKEGTGTAEEARAKFQIAAKAYGVLR